MGAVKTLKDVSNQCGCRRNDVSDPNGYKQPKAKVPERATDLCECQVWLLLRRSREQRRAGLKPGDYCRTMFGFHATAEDHDHIDWTIRLHPEWSDEPTTTPVTKGA